MSNANVIKPNNMFHTPNDWEELMDWINRHHSNESVHLLTAAVMAWNLAAKVTNKETEDV